MRKPKSNCFTRWQASVVFFLVLTTAVAGFMAAEFMLPGQAWAQEMAVVVSDGKCISQSSVLEVPAGMTAVNLQVSLFTGKHCTTNTTLSTASWQIDSPDGRVLYRWSKPDDYSAYPVEQVVLGPGKYILNITGKDAYIEISYTLVAQEAQGQESRVDSTEKEMADTAPETAKEAKAMEEEAKKEPIAGRPVRQEATETTIDERAVHKDNARGGALAGTAYLSSSDLSITIPALDVSFFFDRPTYWKAVLSHVPSNDGNLWYFLSGVEYRDGENRISSGSTESLPSLVVNHQGDRAFIVIMDMKGADASAWAILEYVPSTDGHVWFKVIQSGLK